jgi:hypothetical protein
VDAMVVATAPSWHAGGAGLLLLGVLCAGYFLYRLLRGHHYRQPRGPAFGARVQGSLLGRLGSVPYRTVAGERGHADEALLVEEQGRSVAILAGRAARGLRAGCFVIADGVPATLTLEETLYRQRADQPALLAGRVLVGRWPELSWLRVPVAVGCLIWLLGLACWLFATPPTRPASRLLQRAPVEDVVPSRFP